MLESHGKLWCLSANPIFFFFVFFDILVGVGHLCPYLIWICQSYVPYWLRVQTESILARLRYNEHMRSFLKAKPSWGLCACSSSWKSNQNVVRLDHRMKPCNVFFSEYSAVINLWKGWWQLQSLPAALLSSWMAKMSWRASWGTSSGCNPYLFICFWHVQLDLYIAQASVHASMVQSGPENGNTISPFSVFVICCGPRSKTIQINSLVHSS